MDFQNLKVTTENGSTFTFIKEDGEKSKVLISAFSTRFEQEIVESSISEIKVGKLLTFKYYTGSETETFESRTPIIAIEKL